MGRKKIELTDKQFSSIEYMAMIHCTGEEIAGVLDIDYDTLNARVKEHYGISVAQLIKNKSCNGQMSLRRAQWKSAENGNVTMQIWLGKQWLGQTDNVVISEQNSEVAKEIEELMNSES